MRTEDFERLYTAYAEPLLDFLAHRVGDRMLAEDLLADTFERVLRARRPFDRHKASEKTWLYAIAMNLVRDHARRVKAGQRALERVATELGADLCDELDAFVERDALQRALEHLSAGEREVLALRYRADLTVPEIARRIRQKPSSVGGRVYRALRKVRSELELPPTRAATTGQTSSSPHPNTLLSPVSRSSATVQRDP
jgi:RNA polymerase sigma-70 factor (ECF subfamily)